MSTIANRTFDEEEWTALWHEHSHPEIDWGPDMRISVTGWLVDKSIAVYYNGGYFEDIPMEAINTEPLPDKVDMAYYNCDLDELSEEQQTAMKEKYPNRSLCLITLVVEGKEILAYIADADRFACDWWDECEGDFFETVEDHYNITIDHGDDD